MSMWIYPHVEPEKLKRLEDESVSRELVWLLNSLQESLPALKEGLEGCVALLAAKEPGSTLVLSSLRSESVKGFVTRVGTKVVKGDLQLRLSSLPPNTPRTSGNSTPSTRFTFSPSPQVADLVLPQLFKVRALINDSLNIVDVSRWGGQTTDSSFIYGQLKLLHDHLSEAKACLKGGVATDETSSIPGIDWWRDSIDQAHFQPPLPDYLSLHLSIQDANLVLTVRNLAPSTPGGTPASTDSGFSLSGFSLRNRLLGLGPRVPNHDEVGETFQWRGKQEVIVREKVRVETGDPSLMSVAAKLSALEHEVARCRLNLQILMGKDDDD